MKKLKLAIRISILTAAALTFSACSSLSGDSDNISQSAQESEQSDTNPADLKDSSGNGSHSDTESSTDTSVISSNMADGTYKDETQANKSQADGTQLSDLAQTLRGEYEAFLKGDRSDTISFKEYTDTLCQNVTEEWCLETPATPKSVSYAYIDCGMDGSEELAVLFEQVGEENLDQNFITVFKLYDNDIKNIFCGEYGYRSYASMNEYGYYNYGGSNGASSHTDTYSYVDGLGQTTFIYGVNDEYSAYSLYIPENETYMDVADQEGIGEKIEILQYYFEDYVDGSDYTAFVKGCDYSFYPLDENGLRLEGTAAEDALADGSYDRFWDSTGLNVFSEDEINEKVAAKHKNIGVTEDIIQGKEITWIPLAN